MNVLLVDTVSYDRAPYLQYYINACKSKNVSFDLFYGTETPMVVYNRIKTFTQ